MKLNQKISLKFLVLFDILQFNLKKNKTNNEFWVWNIRRYLDVASRFEDEKISSIMKWWWVRMNNVVLFKSNQMLFIFQCGYNNFSHPHLRLLEMLIVLDEKIKSSGGVRIFVSFSSNHFRQTSLLSNTALKYHRMF